MKRIPVWVKCKCGCCWQAGHYGDYGDGDGAGPTMIDIKKPKCPNCGAKNPAMAKQRNGILKEPFTTAMVPV